MKRKSIFRSLFSILVVSAICFTMALPAKESEQSGTASLLLTHSTINGAYAQAIGGGSVYYGVTSGSRTVFSNMSAGYYNIGICGSWQGTNYYFSKTNYYYNGGVQAGTTTGGPGSCPSIGD